MMQELIDGQQNTARRRREFDEYFRVENGRTKMVTPESRGWPGEEIESSKEAGSSPGKRSWVSTYSGNVKMATKIRQNTTG